MAKLKNSFSGNGGAKPPGLDADNSSSLKLPKASVPKQAGGQRLSVTKAGSVVQALSFGALHTKATGSGSSSQWGSLLGSATSGGASSIVSAGILSNGTLGFVGKLLSLFGGGKSTPAAPTPFVMPSSQQQTLNVAPSGSGSSVSLGVHSTINAGSSNGPAYQTNSTPIDHAAQTSHVVQIVKQALLTSSSLNDVISEI